MKVIFPGTFDPLTNGHLDLIVRASKMFDEVIVLLAENTSKKTLFSFEERKLLIEDEIKDLGNVSVISSPHELTVDAARRLGALPAPLVAWLSRRVPAGGDPRVPQTQGADGGHLTHQGADHCHADQAVSRADVEAFAEASVAVWVEAVVRWDRVTDRSIWSAPGRRRTTASDAPEHLGQVTR